MPAISMFYGILVLMFFRDNDRHHTPHIHARYQGNDASTSIENGEVWIDIHKEDLMLDWELAVNGDSPFRIAPLQ